MNNDIKQEEDNVLESKEAENKAKKKKKWLIKLLILLICILLAVGAYLWMNRPNDDFFFDETARNGLIEARTTEDVQKILDQVVEKGMFNASMNPSPVFYDGTSEGDLWIENIAANHYYTQVFITLDNTGETVFKSGAIKPDQNIEQAKLDKVLKKGEYPATASFRVIDPESLKDIGAVNVKITLTIQN